MDSRPPTFIFAGFALAAQAFSEVTGTPGREAGVVTLQGKVAGGTLTATRDSNMDILV